MKKRVGIVAGVLATLAICCLIIGAVRFVQKRAAEEQELAAEIQLFNQLNSVVGDFHTDVKSLTASGSHELLELQATTLKNKAEASRDKISNLRDSVQKLSGERVPKLMELVDRSKDYVDAFYAFSVTSVTADVLSAKARDMIKASEVFRTAANAVGSPTEGNTTEAIGRVVKLQKNLVIARKPVPKPTASPSGSTVVVVRGNSAWNDDQNAGYRASIRSIVDRYSQGRKVLSGVLTRYDNGAMTQSDQYNWSAQIALRERLLDELDALSPVRPSGDISEHQVMLRAMIAEAVEAMSLFGDCSSADNRRHLSVVSSRNTQVMNRLKRFYGIK